MKIENSLQEDHQIKLTVEVEPEILDSSKKKAARRIAQKVKIPGFRPGKAPFNVVQKQIGDAAILEDAIDLLLEDYYPKIVEEAGISPYGPGSLQNILSMEPPTFEFLVPLAPEVTLGDYKGVRLEMENKSATDEDVDKVLENLRQRQAAVEPADRAVEEGDLTYVTLSAERQSPDEDGNTALIAERKYPVLIDRPDTDTAEEWPFPGFSRKLIGVMPGDSITLEYTFPSDYEMEELRDVTGLYHVRVEETKSRILPELNDDFAKVVSSHETMAALKGEILTSLQSDFSASASAEFEAKVLGSIVESSSVKYPPQLLAHELEHMLEDFQREIQNQGMSLDLYLKTREITLDELKAELSPRAIERVTRGLVLMELARAENIEVSQELAQERLNQTILEIQQTFPEEDARRLLNSESLQSIANRIITDEVTRLTLERIGKIARNEPIEIEIPAEQKDDNGEHAGAVSESVETNPTEDESRKDQNELS